ncbi:hypothetical protein GCM10027280_00790 [Micromonospora polyrhachis]|uniref:Low molecular weight protein antigen 6 PH domain-containing protein n=1 Tax=Micromonospora polyrhachis TaxID=1282883 RepID=A0A7W7SMR8_9ACTN|nr:PH domain-containing protein [Micromonospora polyrhachis]MBB4957625.1 hypothetical protein [Micromonospora polyrhachis]
MSSANTIRFRHSQAILVAAIVAFIGTLPLASARWFLVPLLLVPLAVGVWAWRAGTDADPQGLHLRALFGQRLIPWSRVVELTADPRGQAVVRLDDGSHTRLPAVRAEDLHKLVTASGQTIEDPAQ